MKNEEYIFISTKNGYYNIIINMDLLINRRNGQLEEQKKLDDQLSVLIPICPDVVSQYLLFRRSVNRKQYDKVKTDGIVHAYTNIHKNLDENDHDQKQVLSLVKGEMPCEQLRQYISR